MAERFPLTLNDIIFASLGPFGTFWDIQELREQKTSSTLHVLLALGRQRRRRHPESADWPRGAISLWHLRSVNSRAL